MFDNVREKNVQSRLLRGRPYIIFLFMVLMGWVSKKRDGSTRGNSCKPKLSDGISNNEYTIIILLMDHGISNHGITM